MGKIVRGVNDLRTINPGLARQWDYTQNENLRLEDVTANSHRKAGWICPDCGYRWKATIASRNRGAGCPACSHRVAIEGKTDLATLAPSLLEEWDYDKNTDIKPTQVACYSSKKVWWKCKKCGYSWPVEIAKRTARGDGCPVCAGRKVVQGINDLKTINPNLADQWDYTQNGNLRPGEVTANSGRKAGWICPDCGYHWRAVIASRNNGAGCPRCAKMWQTSLPEQIIFYYIKKCFSDAINNYKPDWLNGSEIDVYIPSLKLGIEYDGAAWHQNVEKDIEKDVRIFAHGIKMIHVREAGIPELNDDSFCICVKHNYKDYMYMENAVNAIFDYMQGLYSVNFLPDTDIRRDFAQIFAAYRSKKKDSSLGIVRPDLLEEWDYAENGELSPFQVTPGADIKVHWKCKKCGYLWIASIGSRDRGSGCPNCANKVVIPGQNDLATVMPQLAQEWYQKGMAPLTPQDVTVNSNKKVSWICSKCGHIWKARVSDRCRGSGCPACSGRVATTGKTDLQTLLPQLAEEWCYENNGGLTPQDVSPGSNKKVWWCCKKCGHTWQAAIYSRVAGRGCPLCRETRRHETGKMPQEEFEDKLYKKNPQIAVLGKYYNNKTKIECECKLCGHRWSPTPNSVLCGRGCPICARKRLR